MNGLQKRCKGTTGAGDGVARSFFTHRYKPDVEVVSVCLAVEWAVRLSTNTSACRHDSTERVLRITFTLAVHFHFVLFCLRCACARTRMAKSSSGYGVDLGASAAPPLRNISHPPLGFGTPPSCMHFFMSPDDPFRIVWIAIDTRAARSVPT